MRKDLTCLGLALLLSSSTFVSAQEKMPSTLEGVSRYRAINGNEKNITPLYKAQSGKGVRSIQDVEYRVLDSLVNAFSMYSGNIQPFVYSPEAGRLAFVHRGAENTPVGQQTSKDDIYITVSEDWGATWTRHYGPLRPEGITLGARYPSLMIVKPEDVVTYVYSFPLVVRPNAGTGEWGWGAVVQGILEESNPTTPYGERDNGTTGAATYQWNTDTKMVSVDQYTIIQVAGLTAAGSPASENNAIGLRVTDLQGENPFVPTHIPPQWNSTQFVEPSASVLAQNVGARTNTVVGVDKDAQGNIYVGISGNFKDNNPDQRALPAVSMSSDNGATWSAFELCPNSLIQDYIASVNALPDSASIGFADGFVTTGNGNFSFVTNFFFKTPEDLVNTQAHIIEVYKENGSWGIRKVAETSGLVWNFFAEEGNPTLTSSTQMGSEMQIVKTVDGSTLMVKWIDFVDYTLDGATQPSSDVFVVARKLDGNWSAQPMNVTSNPLVDKITWLPNLIPNDLNNIPMLSTQSEVLSTETSEVDRFVTSQRHLVDRKQYIVETRFNASQTVGVEENTPDNGTVYLGNSYPNPLAGQGTIQFTLPASGHATLDIYNVMGQKVMSLVNGFTSTGTHYVNVNTSDLPSGTYYYTLKWNGTSETRTMSVVR
jgi:hypothetical protein